jgi:tetratricopeptide (TPR) repeat protein
MYHSLLKYEQALIDYTMAAHLRSDDEDIYYNRGCVYFDMGKHELAIADFQTVMDLVSCSSKLRQNAVLMRGLCYQDMGQHEPAIADFSSVLKSEQDPVAYYNRAISYFELGALQQAKSDYTASILLNPCETDAYYNRSLLYGQERLYVLALSDLVKTRTITQIVDGEADYKEDLEQVIKECSKDVLFLNE